MAHCPHPKSSSEDQSPISQLSLVEDWKERLNDHDHQMAKQLEHAKNHYDKTSNQLKLIPTGSKFWIQDPTNKIWDRTATVQDKKQDREYVLLLPLGTTHCRSQRFIWIFKNRKEIITTPHCENTLKDNNLADKSPNVRRPKRLKFATYKYNPLN
ncbi:unnamed protein product [Lepeophtheirus salmonis]|uniref:(salmon louse) hypothetical protein n=1 Tax=Lepeophtheirus salmonis TaxID=72036 RepID=A0A7R8CIL2_LEPSM|nr:unnamed protein product [Lepeophtheirus salmonis]CAF2832408.1 unnamed protein product [Lepeophtheirus salmonis]